MNIEKTEKLRKALPMSAIKAMCEAWGEMNAIRARDGVPYYRDGRKSDVSQQYWDDIMERLDKEVVSASGRGCWHHPSLYALNESKLSHSEKNL